MACGLALLGTLWLPWEGSDTGWVSLATTDLAVCVAAAAALALWLTEGARTSWPAAVAPVASAVALLAIVRAVAEIGVGEVGTYAAPVCALALTATCFAVTGFARWRATDWSIDIAALALLVSMFLPWQTTVFPDLFPSVWSDPDTTYDAWRAFSYADVLLLLAVVVAVASTHARGHFADPWPPVRGSAIAAVAIVLEQDWSRLDYGAPLGLASVAALFLTTHSVARGSGHLREPRRRGVPALD